MNVTQHSQKHYLQKPGHGSNRGMDKEDVCIYCVYTHTQWGIT